MVRRKRKLKKTGLLIIIIFLIMVVALGYIVLKKIKDEKLLDIITKENNLVESIKSHYNKYVITSKETDLFDKDGNKIGKINKDINLVLDDIDITKETKYFKITNLEDTYISYNDVTKAKEVTKSDRYKKYIPYNQNIKTKDKTTFYNRSKELVYEINKSIDSPIIVKDNDYYGIEYDNEILYVKKDNGEVYDHHNTDKHNTNGAAVLNYHFFYDENNADDRMGCREEICASKSQFKSHLEYFKQNNILPITMDELEMYMDKKIQLPKSVLITIDDGGRTKVGIDLLTEYKMNGTIFLITSWYNPKTYEKSEYIELHSHSHNLHNGGKCPGGQGGEIKCLDKALILDDLKKSRESLDGSTAFCYPFYEYNSYSEELVKEAGFTMAFIGEVVASYGPYKLAEPGGNKMQIPRFVVVNYTTISEFNRYFNEIK